MLEVSQTPAGGARRAERSASPEVIRRIRACAGLLAMTLAVPTIGGCAARNVRVSLHGETIHPLWTWQKGQENRGGSIYFGCKPDAIAKAGKTWTLCKKGKFQKAMRVANEALRIDPTCADAYNNRGLARIGLGDFVGAIADFTRAITSNPADAAAYANRGLATGLKDDNPEGYRASLVDIDKSLQLQPDFDDALILRAIALTSLFRDSEAAVVEERVLSLHPEDKDLLMQGVQQAKRQRKR